MERRSVVPLMWPRRVVLVEEEVEVCLPWMVVVVIAREHDGNMVGDGDITELGGGRSGGGGGGEEAKGLLVAETEDMVERGSTERGNGGGREERWR
jgi:hypothetical protein